VDQAFLDDFSKQGLLSDQNSARHPREELTPEPKPDEVVVFAEQLECGLRVPSSEFLREVLRLFRLETRGGW
jgi:hypothetical protein